MGKKALPIVVIVLLLLLGGWYFVTKKSSPVATLVTTGTTQNGSAASLKDLIAKGVAQTCTFSDQGTSGTVYVEGNKVREDFDITQGGQTMKSHVIVMNNTIYNWSDGQKTGIKMAYDPNAPTPPPSESPSTEAGGSFDANTSLNYKCSAGVGNASLFTLPAGVTFTSFTAPAQAAPGESTSGSSSSQCSYCNALSGDDKTQCLAALNCK